MDARSILAIIGGFCMSYGSLLISRAESKNGWWIGQGMLCAGPLLMVSRAIPKKAPKVKRRRKPAE